MYCMVSTVAQLVGCSVYIYLMPQLHFTNYIRICKRYICTNYNQLSCLISHIRCTKVWKPQIISLKYLSTSLYKLSFRDREIKIAIIYWIIIAYQGQRHSLDSSITAKNIRLPLNSPNLSSHRERANQLVDNDVSIEAVQTIGESIMVICYITMQSTQPIKIQFPCNCTNQ